MSRVSLVGPLGVRKSARPLGAGLLGALLVLVLVAAGTKADEFSNVDALIQQHVAAGEFGVARRMAQKADDARLRDRWLAHIAAAQAQAGARRASIRTAAEIGDDLARSRALQQISAQPVGAPAARGGGVVADFDSLIDLITTTIAPESWDEVGGPGSIDSFEGGVYVDSAGVMRRILSDSASSSLAAIRNKAAASTGNPDVRRSSPLRKVSLRRLEREAELRHALGRAPDDVMKSLAGIYKVQYVLVYPETGDIVLAGPAGDWQVNREGRKVNTETGRPVLSLDDLVVCLRNAYAEDGRFGCSITPRKANLAATKKFLATSRAKGAAWRSKLRQTLGKQDIVVHGVDPRTRVARVMVEADYRMKLVGMGLEAGTAGVTSYLNLVKLDKDGNPPPMEVIRWWFALNYDAVRSTKARDAFEIHGQGVKVLSENELLTETGERVHTGRSGGPTLEFAHSFTRHFDQLAQKYSIYAELRNIFDLALVAALIKAEDLPGQVGWPMTYFGPRRQADMLAYRVELATAPKEVDTVMNHRIVRQGRVVHTIVGVSGGVAVDTRRFVRRDAIRMDDYGLMEADRAASAPKNLPRHAWWWD